MAYPFPRYRKPYHSHDPLLTEIPHDLWILPAHLSAYGPFEILGVRDLEHGPTRRLFIDIKIRATAETFTLILPLTLCTSTELTRWERLGHPRCRYTVARVNPDAPRWGLRLILDASYPD